MHQGNTTFPFFGVTISRLFICDCIVDMISPFLRLTSIISDSFMSSKFLYLLVSSSVAEPIFSLVDLSQDFLSSAAPNCTRQKMLSNEDDSL